MIDLSDKKKSWVGNRSVKLKGHALHPSVSEQIIFKKKINQSINYIHKFFNDVLPNLNNINDLILFRETVAKVLDKEVFNEHVFNIARGMVVKVLKQSKLSFNTSMRKLTGEPDFNLGPASTLDIGIKNTITEAISNSVDKIKTIHSTYRDSVKGDMDDFILGDNGNFEKLKESIHYKLEYRYQQHANKAKNLANDQVRTTFNHLNLERMKGIGVKKFEWLHTGGGKESRPLHIEYSGQIFDIDNPPILEPGETETGYPGDAINCRCVMIPVIEFDEGEQDG